MKRHQIVSVNCNDLLLLVVLNAIKLFFQQQSYLTLTKESIIPNNMLLKTQNVVIMVQIIGTIFTCHFTNDYNERDKRSFHGIKQGTFDERNGKLFRFLNVHLRVFKEI